jgi:hypothetical protein
VAFKIAAKPAPNTDLLKANEAIVAKNVTENIYVSFMLLYLSASDRYPKRAVQT